MQRDTSPVTLEDVPELRDIAFQLREHLLIVPSYFDAGTPEKPTPERVLFQLIFRINSQNFFSMLACLGGDHVIPAGQLARALLEESIRWEWITDHPQDRHQRLMGELRRNLRNIEEECLRLGVDCESFLNPSPFWNTETLRPYEGATGFPGVETMLRQIESRGRSAADSLGFELPFKVRDALYAQYRVLSQLTHTSILGMTATMQAGREQDEDVDVGRSLPLPIMALILHTSAASVVNVAQHVTHAYAEELEKRGGYVEWVMAAFGLAGDMAEKAGPIHKLTTF